MPKASEIGPHRPFLIAGKNARVSRGEGVGGRLELGDGRLCALAFGHVAEAAGIRGTRRRGRADARGLDDEGLGEQGVRAALHMLVPRKVGHNGDANDHDSHDDTGRFPAPRLEPFARLPRQVLQLVLFEMMPFRSLHLAALKTDGRRLRTVFAPGRTRTCGPRFRKPVLYPPELRAPILQTPSVTQA